MPFKEHPYYDCSDASNWLNLDDDLLQQAHGEVSAALLREMRGEKEQLCTLALARIKEHAGAGFLSERPHPLEGVFLFHPTSESSYRAYIEYYFLEKPVEFYLRRSQSTPDSDHWWAIINCPNVLTPFWSSQKYYVVGIGWIVR